MTTLPDHTRNPSVITDRVLSQVLAERIRQDAKWGEQNHPDGTGDRRWADAANVVRGEVDDDAQLGRTHWNGVLREEVFEALAEADPAKLRAELLQVAAVAVAWIEAIDRRTPTAEACGKCKRPFDPTDTAFDGRAQYAATPYCCHCVDLCHDNNSADHRCVICG